MEGKGVLGRTLPVSLLGAALPASKADLKVILSILGEGEQEYEQEQEAAGVRVRAGGREQEYEYD